MYFLSRVLVNALHMSSSDMSAYRSRFVRRDARRDSDKMHLYNRGQYRPMLSMLWLGLACVVSLQATVQAATLADYERANRFLNARGLVSRLDVKPNWISNGDAFWYIDEHERVTTFMLVDPDRNTKGPAFDHARLAAALSSAIGSRYAGTSLPFSRFEYQDEGSVIAFKAESNHWRCNIVDYSCVASARPAGKLPGEVLSPDGRLAAFLRDHNLWVRDTLDGRETALTTDGEPNYDYATRIGTGSVSVERRLPGPMPEPELYFSSDSKRLLSYQLDTRRVRQQAVLESIPGARPKLHSYRYILAGDEDVATAQMVVFDLAVHKAVPVMHSPLARLTVNMPPVAWSSNGARVAFLQEERGFRRAKIQLVEAASGLVRTVAEEISDTYVNPGIELRLVDAGERVLWTSERDGWNHLYITDFGRDDPIQITSGEWVVRKIVHVDEQGGSVYFTAGGRESAQDPYYKHLYRVKFDGKNLQKLTPEHGDHSVEFSPTGRYFVDTWSRLDSPPVSVLRHADGRLVQELQRADIKRLQQAGWNPPRSFRVKAADGRTDIYGALFLPSNFDPNKRYAVLDSIYPGPQFIKTWKSFAIPGSLDELALAELGFIVVTIDGLGTPFRSKDFRDVSYGNLGSAGGLEDHIAGLKQLAQRYPQIDLDRVGTYGHSGGGYASARAVLKYPEFYKVAVASAGNHDQRTYAASWGERFHYWPVNDETYASQANTSLATNLIGKLLLVHGGMDDNVHPTNTLQLADALIAANKDFDLLILPNRDHGFVDLGQAGGASHKNQKDPYFIRKRWDYFVRHLKGENPPSNFAVQYENK